MVDTTGDPGLVRTAAADDDLLRARIQGEYQEIPGLSLTVAQAARLFDVDISALARILDTLVTAGVLWTDGREYFSRSVSRR